MKRLLSIIGTITLIGTSTTSLVACNKPQEYTPEKLAELKKEKEIKTNDGILEWITPQEKPMHKLDNKFYYVIWRPETNSSWRLVHFQNNKKQRYHEFDEIDKYYIYIGELDKLNNFDILINQKPSSIWSLKSWQNSNNEYIKSVYRWNSDKELPKLNIDKDGNYN